MLKARQAGKVRYIGFTGHKSPDIHLEMLKTAFAHGVTFDAVQMPLNVMDAHFDSFEARVLPVLGALPASIERAFEKIQGVIGCDVCLTIVEEDPHRL